MKINVWGINYAPEPIGIAVYNTDLCNFLAECGDQVTMVTAFPYYPQWQKSVQDRWIIYRNEERQGVKIYRCWQYVPALPSAWLRILHEGSFVLTSFLRQALLPAPDLYIVVSPPLLLGFAAWVISLLKGAPFILHLQDLQPDAAVKLGMLKRSALTAILYGLAKLAYDKAVRVSAISDAMCRALKKEGVPEAKVVFFPNWITAEAKPANNPISWKELHGIDGTRPIVSYAGNLGVKQGLDIVIEAASLLNEKHPALFVIAGNGAQREHLKQMAKRKALNNIIFTDVLSNQEHIALLNCSELCLVTLKRGSGDSFLPSKLLKILVHGRAVLTNADKESALGEAIRQNRFGLAAGDNAQDFAAAIVELLKHRDRLSELEKRGKEYVLQFDRSIMLNNFRNTLISLVNG